MSNFCCEKCGAVCIDTEAGYVTGCEHYPVESWREALRDRAAEAVQEERLAEIRAGLERDRVRYIQPDDPPLAETPTSHRCGSKAKIKVMRERFKRGESVFHPHDTERKIAARSRTEDSGRVLVDQSIESSTI